VPSSYRYVEDFMAAKRIATTKKTPEYEAMSAARELAVEQHTEFLRRVMQTLTKIKDSQAGSKEARRRRGVQSIIVR
jgi:hypothetical protein